MINGINIAKIKEILKNGNIVLTHRALPLALISSVLLTGCESKSIIEKLELEGISVKTITEYPSDDVYKITKCNADNLNNFKSDDLATNYTATIDYDTICTPKEFSKYTNEENLTWNDIRNTLNRIDLNEEIYDILNDSIDNLEKNSFNANLSVLNYNLKNLTVQYTDSIDEDIVEGGGVGAKFDAINHKVIINSTNNTDDKFKSTVIHEILGHGMTMAYIPESKVYCTTTMNCCLISDNEYHGKYIFGKSLDEATAEFITCFATNEKIEYDYTVYTTSEYGLLLLCESNDVSIREYAENGVQYLIKKMKQNGLNTQIDYITYLDEKLSQVIFYNSDTDYTLEDVTTDYLYTLMSNELDQNIDVETVKKDMYKLIDCYKPYINPYIQEEDNITAFAIWNDYYTDYIGIEDLKSNVRDYAELYENEYQYVK